MIVVSAVLFSSVIFFLVCYWMQTRTRYAKLLNKFPQVEPFIPALGNITAVSRNTDTLFEETHKIIGKYHETFGAWASVYGLLNIVTAEDAEIILSSKKHINKGTIYEGLQCWLGTGLITSTGEKWHQRRKMLTSSFHYNILQIFVKIFGEHSENLVKKLKSMETENINIIPIISKLTLATICETSMGIQINENDKLASNYYYSLHSFADIAVKRILSPWLYPDFIYYSYIFPLAWKEHKLLKFMRTFTQNIIKRREETFKDSDVLNLEINNEDRKKRLAMLDLLIHAKQMNEIHDEGIREEVETFIFAGHDTTYVAITFTLFVLANHKDVQEKVINELDKIFGTSNRHATYEDIQNMKYLECCIKETLRLYPSVPLIMRKPTTDVQLTHHVAPAGTDIFIHIYNIHRDPKYFKDPEVFDPNRFLPENCKGRHPYAYIPFSAGPRNCIGQKFSMLEVKSITSAVLRNFTLEAIDKLESLKFIFDFVLRINGTMKIKFIPRN